jgi:hypothetical protein
MNYMENLVQKLDAAWDENGFFDHLRSGIFTASEASDYLEILRSINLHDQELVPTRLLALIWYIPSFLEWQRERVSENGGDVKGYARFITNVTNTLEDVIGVP